MRRPCSRIFTSCAESRDAKRWPLISPAPLLFLPLCPGSVVSPPPQSVDVVIDETYLMRSPMDYKLADFTKNTGLTPEEVASIKFLSPDSPNVWSIYGQFRAGSPPATGAPSSFHPAAPATRRTTGAPDAALYTTYCQVYSLHLPAPSLSTVLVTSTLVLASCAHMFPC